LTWLWILLSILGGGIVLSLIYVFIRRQNMKNEKLENEVSLKYVDEEDVDSKKGSLINGDKLE